MKYTLFLCLLLLQTVTARAQQPAAANTAKYLPLLEGKRVALVINQASVVSGASTLDILLHNGVGMKKIFVPEHGFRGTADAGAHINNSIDSATGLPVISLYGAHKQPSPADLADIDVVVYDLQDVGTRFYTYIATLEYCMEACAQNHKKLIVLDRPNPNGFYVDGPLPEPANRSLVCMQQVPVVYGMTAGEYALMLKGEEKIGKEKESGSDGEMSSRGMKEPEEDSVLAELDLEVIPCVDYDHTKKYILPVAPSPNLRAEAAVYAYPSLCLFEGTVVSVGRGTGMPFEQYGCPEFQGIFFHGFTPESMEGATHPPYEGKRCYGEVVGMRPEDVLKTIDNKLYLGWLIKAYNAYPDKDKFFTPFFVKLCGSAKLMGQIKNGVPEAEIRASWEPGLKAFKEIRKKYLLYKDFE